MILTCPSCGTRYQTAEAQFKPPGRNVRCAKCRHVWFQATPELDVPIEPEPVISPAAPEAPAATAALNFGPQAQTPYAAAEEETPPRRSRGAALAQSVGWLALLPLLGAIAWETITKRDKIAG